MKYSSVRSVLSMTQRAALENANFILYGFWHLPERYQILNETFRAENEREDYHRASYRTIIQDNKTDSEIIIKQFYYDWAPPAYSCPLLWTNYIKFDKDTIPMPFSFKIKDKIAWIGKNYRNEPGLSLTINRTTIEISIKEGIKDVDEEQFILKDLASNLSTVDLSSQTHVIEKTYAELSYARDKKVNMIHVPISFWECSLSNELKYQQAFSYHSLPEFTKELMLNISEKYNYNIDSVFAYFEEEGLEHEGRIEYIYSHKYDKDENIRILTWPKVKEHTISYPPTPDITQKFHYEQVELNGQQVYLAYRTEEFGPFEAVFQGNQHNYLFISKAKKFNNKDLSIEILQDIFASNSFIDTEGE